VLYLYGVDVMAKCRQQIDQGGRQVLIQLDLHATSGITGNGRYSSAEAAAKGTPEHGPLKHFQAIEVPFDRPRSPRQSQCGLDRLIVKRRGIRFSTGIAAKKIILSALSLSLALSLAI